MIKINIDHLLGEMNLKLDIEIPSKGITAIFGRSGSGKTSIINAVSGLIRPDKGRISIDDRTLFDSETKTSLPIEQRNIGYVFQDARLFPHYSVKGNLLYGVKGELDKAYFSHILELLHLEHLLERYPSDLSGGEKQRVAIARALLSSPQVLLMDEPLASLDLPRKKEVMPFLEKLSKEIQIPILYVTHSLNEILRLADHLVLIQQGKVVDSGTLEAVWGSEAMAPWQSFSEKSTLLEGKIDKQHDKYALTRILLNRDTGIWVQKIDGEPGEKIRLQIRLNDVSVTLDKPEKTSIRNIIPAVISKIDVKTNHHGNLSITLSLDLGDGCVLEASVTQWALDELELKTGLSVYAQIKGVSITQKDMAILPVHD
ncbi:molybdenum ABC transporter ATP-binding protein ModC [Vibrio sp. JC009]|uniref:molybdenum ABC transporter ATP-binding protein ModC n=1 Tax=Vibrio sp. JC009 TaxID=2912314 RepID=UPI0023B0FD4E|nr:molybdenum ABC transporter ATP-binding protein ModC [Vibrio sp. JC009]WED24362.1 molybdenum ABC transporter ATP-binding protein ModC [Vibrio sp. JC009]